MYHHITTQKAIIKIECEVIKFEQIYLFYLDFRKEIKS